MTPTEQDKELEKQLVETILSILGITDRSSGNRSEQIATLEQVIEGYIIADRKRVALEAKIEVCDKYLGFRAASDTEHEAIQWLDFQRDELHTELKAQQEEV